MKKKKRKKVSRERSVKRKKSGGRGRRVSTRTPAKRSRKKVRVQRARSAAKKTRKQRARVSTPSKKKVRHGRVAPRKKVPAKRAKKIAKVSELPKVRKLPPLVGPVIHAFPGRGVPASLKMTEKERDEQLLKRAKEAYEAGSLDQDYLDIALELGVSDHDAYSAAFGYLPMTAGVAA